MLPAYPLVLAAAQTDGAALANSTTATNILHASGIPTIPAGALQVNPADDVPLQPGSFLWGVGAYDTPLQRMRAAC